MNKIPVFIFLQLISTGCFAQVIGTVDRRSKELTIAANQKTEYTIYGYQFASASAPKFLCFSTNQDVVRANGNDKLGAYFDTYRLPPGTKLVFMGFAGAFGKFNFIGGDGKKTLVYLPKANFAVR